MGSWTSLLTDALWRNALAVIPLVLLVGAACRWLPCRPATRHSLWLFILAWLVVPPMLPSFNPVSDAEPAAVDDASEVALDPNRAREEAAIDRSNTELPPLCAESPNQNSPQAPTPPWTEDSTMLRAPARLASAADLVGSLSAHGSEPSRTPIPPQCKTWLARREIAEREGRYIAQRRAANPNRAREEAALMRRPRNTTNEIRQPLPILDSQLAILNSTSVIPPHEISYPLPCIEEKLTTAIDCIPLPDPSLSDSQLLANAGIINSSESAVVREAIPQSPAPISTPDRFIAGLINAAHPWIIALTSIRDAVGRLPAVPPVVWIGGVALIFACRLVRTIRVRRILTRGRRAPAEVTAMVRKASRRIGLRTPPQTLIVPDRVSPMVWCGLTPRLILPRDLWNQLDDVGREAVLLHELAHVRRRDHLINWIETIVGSLYWWHPVVWWVRTRLREEAENCCDAWVTWLLPRGRRAYAEALLVTRQYVTEGGAPEPAGGIGVISGRARRFGRRLTMVMTQRSAPNFSVSGVALVFAMASAGWLATPASSCPKSDAPKANAGTTCQTVETPAAPRAAVMAVPAPEAPKGITIAGAPAPVTPLPPRLRTTTPAPSLAVVAPPAMPSLPAQLLLAGPTAPPARGSGNVEDRLERLERQLERLADQLERINGGQSRGQGRSGAAAAPRAESVHVMPSESSGGEMTRRYELSGEKLKKLTALMVRDDVPIKVRAADGAIEVIAGNEQHMIFEAFVNMIDQPDDTRYYELSSGKLDALNELMALEDVPVMVHPGSDKIGVNGGGAVQTIFGAFVRMIEPEAQSGDVRRRVSKKTDVEWKKQMEKELHKAHKAKGEYARQALRGLPAEARAEVERALAEARNAQHHAADEARMALEEAARALKNAKGEARQRIRESLRHKAQGADQRARELERRADELEHEADQLRDKADALRERAESTNNHEESQELLTEAESLDGSAAEFEAASEQLYAQVDQFNEVADSLNDSVEEDVDLHENAELHEAHEDLADEADEDVEDDEDAEDDEDDEDSEE